MTKKRKRKRKFKNKKREYRSLKAPFTRKRLEKFLASVPEKARIRVVTVNFAGLSPQPSVAYLEASWPAAPEVKESPDET